MDSFTAPPPAQGEGLNVIALISGGKDSFFSLLHCLAHGHRVVALANLHPPETDEHEEAQQEEEDLNSFMYQTVGHQVIPLYAEATGIPLYRQPILGGATQGKDYSHFPAVSKIAPGGSESESAVEIERQDDVERGLDKDDDETESMIPLLLAIKRAHPEANAICAGAILSTYQRTRVESVAVRLGLTPLAFLWKFPILPVPESAGADVADAQLLDDMAAAGMEARIIKVASGGLDDSFLWTNVADRAGKERIARSMRRFGTASEKGAVIGEGGEFETLVLDGPAKLFRKRIVVEEKDRRVVREGGGCAWLNFGSAKLEDKDVEVTAAADDEEEGEAGKIRIPDLLDARFVVVLKGLDKSAGEEEAEKLLALLSLDPQQGLSKQEGTPQLGLPQSLDDSKLRQWCFFGNASSSSSAGSSSTIETETSSLISQIRQQLQQFNLPPSAILTSTILLRHMADFPAVNTIYGALFDAPNPPSRVCVACGDSLSALAGSDSSNSSNINIAIYLTVHTGFTNTSKTDQRRQGLHVQSRSYWAPANIGPYSQAISIPLVSLSSQPFLTENENSGPRLVTIAGQIPLVPATMALPPSVPSSSERQALKTQLAISLQHLWRIGVEVGVQWWTSAVAYFPTDPSTSSSSMPMSEKARLAYKTWQAAHQWSPKVASDDDSDANSDSDENSEDEDSDAGGPDLWDRKFNSRYMSFAVTSSEQSSSGEPKLPDWGILSNTNKNNNKKKKRSTIPPFFAAQVSELPRSAGVEWHAHLGVAKAGAKSVEVLDSFLVNLKTVDVSVGGNEGDGGDDGRVVEIHQTVIRSPASTSSHEDDDNTDDDDDHDDNNGVKNTASGRRPATLLQTILVERQTAGSSSSPSPSPSPSFTGLNEIARLAAHQLISPEHGEAEKGGDPSVSVRYLNTGVYNSALSYAGPDGVPVVPCASLWSGNGERLASVTIYRSVFE